MGSVRATSRPHNNSPTNQKRTVPDVPTCQGGRYGDSKKKQEQGLIIMGVGSTAAMAGVRYGNPVLIGGGTLAVVGGNFWSAKGKAEEQEFERCNRQLPRLEEKF